MNPLITHFGVFIEGSRKIPHDDAAEGIETSGRLVEIQWGLGAMMRGKSAQQLPLLLLVMSGVHGTDVFSIPDNIDLCLNYASGETRDRVQLTRKLLTRIMECFG